MGLSSRLFGSTMTVLITRCWFLLNLARSKLIEHFAVTKSYLHAKFAEYLFLLRFKVAFDCSLKKLAAHLVEVSVSVKSFNRQIQTCVSLGDTFWAAL